MMNGIMMSMLDPRATPNQRRVTGVANRVQKETMF